SVGLRTPMIAAQYPVHYVTELRALNAAASPRGGGRHASLPEQKAQGLLGLKPAPAVAPLPRWRQAPQDKPPIRSGQRLDPGLIRCGRRPRDVRAGDWGTLPASCLFSSFGAACAPAGTVSFSGSPDPG